jgi:hypothetical protein
MDRFNNGDGDETIRFSLSDPADASGSIIGDEGEIGAAVVDLRNALIVDHISVAMVEVIDEDEEEVDERGYAVAFAGFLPSRERREMMVMFTPETLARAVILMMGVGARAGDVTFLTSMLAHMSEAEVQHGPDEASG